MPKPSTKELPKIVSLFCGAGGLDLGFHNVGFDISVAMDISEAAIKTHSRNFQNTSAIVADFLELGANGVMERVKKEIPIGSRIGVIGGPPCQGFSRANANSHADDPRNKLSSLYLKIIDRLKKHYVIEFVVFENVLGLRDKKHAHKYKSIISGLNKLGLDVTEKELCALDFGVPQNRRRIILSAMRKGQAYNVVKPLKHKGLTTVREAISGLSAPVYFSRGLKAEDIPVHPNHWTMRPKSSRFQGGPVAKKATGRSFRRLSWNKPSPTIAFGNREIYVHPNGKRRLSIYEAMLLQGFPEEFILEGNLSEQVQQISNAVPPPLAQSVAQAVKRSMEGK